MKNKKYSGKRPERKAGRMKKYDVTLDVFMMENIYEVEARNEKEAFEKAKEQSHYRGEAELTLFEITLSE